MVILIINGFAHRVLNNGMVESAPVVKSEDGIIVQDDWRGRAPEEMHLTGAEAFIAQKELSRYSSIFPEDDYRLPSSEPSQEVRPEATQLRST
jgi:hypothetical protein